MIIQFAHFLELLKQGAFFIVLSPVRHPKRWWNKLLPRFREVASLIRREEGVFITILLKARLWSTR
jgi:hypothetical protein